MAALQALQSPGPDAPCVGGLAFGAPPSVEVVDAGGNRLVADFDSAVEVKSVPLGGNATRHTHTHGSFLSALFFVFASPKDPLPSIQCLLLLILFPPSALGQKASFAENPSAGRLGPSEYALQR